MIVWARSQVIWQCRCSVTQPETAKVVHPDTAGRYRNVIITSDTQTFSESSRAAEGIRAVLMVLGTPMMMKASLLYYCCAVYVFLCTDDGAGFDLQRTAFMSPQIFRTI